MSLSAPAKPPVPASSILNKKSPSSAPSLPSKPKIPKINIKTIIIILLILLISGLTVLIIRRFPSSNNPPKISHNITPTPQATTSATPTTFSIPGLPTDIPQPTDSAWSRLISEQAGLFYDYPSTFTRRESSDIYKNFHPSWYDPEHYFDCINRQVGTRFPFPCWLFAIQLSTADPELISEIKSGKLTDFSGNQQQYQDGSSRNWQINGPINTSNSQIYLAETEINQVIYQLETQFITRSLDQYLRTHKDRPFARDITIYNSTSLSQAHLNLLQQTLNSFQTYRKPLITEPVWVRHRFNNNWSIAYPQTWNIYTPNQPDLHPSIDFSDSDEGRIQGWYGNGDSVGFHHYSITLTTPDLSQAPPSASLNIDNWITYALSNYTEKQRQQIEIIGAPKRRGRRGTLNIEYATTTLVNVPENNDHFLNQSLVNLPVHQAYIWEFAGLPPRIVTIRQLDGLFEPWPMLQLLNTFTKKIYE